ncbi:MAG: divalent-cation tolerance protein CutA [Acidobacteria bacterium]|nr:divalent-cation tolerance protein CutA [Acidobacteriota bacterium]
MLIVMTTTPNADEANSLARTIIENKLAACVQILPPMTSVYVWDGSVQTESEHLLLIKTLEEKFDDLERFINANHSYDVPEIVAVKSEAVSNEYLKWINEYVGTR